MLWLSQVLFCNECVNYLEKQQARILSFLENLKLLIDQSFKMCMLSFSVVKLCSVLQVMAYILKKGNSRRTGSRQRSSGPEYEKLATAEEGMSSVKSYVF